MEEFTPVPEKSTKKVYPYVSVDSQAFVVIVYVCLIFNNFSNFQGSALIIYSAVLRKSMNETVFLKIK